MKSVTIKINTENAAFAEGRPWSPQTEVGRILYRIVERLDCGRGLPEFLMDSNGNCVGTVEVEE